MSLHRNTYYASYFELHCLILDCFSCCTNLQSHVISKPRSVSILEVFLSYTRHGTFHLDCAELINSQREKVKILTRTPYRRTARLIAGRGVICGFNSKSIPTQLDICANVLLFARTAMWSTSLVLTEWENDWGSRNHVTSWHVDIPHYDVMSYS